MQSCCTCCLNCYLDRHLKCCLNGPGTDLVPKIWMFTLMPEWEHRQRSWDLLEDSLKGHIKYLDFPVIRSVGHFSYHMRLVTQSYSLLMRFSLHLLTPPAVIGEPPGTRRNIFGHKANLFSQKTEDASIARLEIVDPVKCRKWGNPIYDTKFSWSNGHQPVTVARDP